jgi:hypothetical protein
MRVNKEVSPIMEKKSGVAFEIQFGNKAVGKKEIPVVCKRLETSLEKPAPLLTKEDIEAKLTKAE